MPAVPIEDVIAFLDDYLRIDQFPDHPNALNGLQVAGPATVNQFAVAVDAREAVIDSVKDWADLLIVHHGLFWAGLQPLAGPHLRRVQGLLEGGTALYSVHLPLDAHAEVGNAAVLARELGLKSLEPFGAYEGVSIGWKGRIHAPTAEISQRLAALTGGDVQVLPGGPEMIQTLGIVTGGGASYIGEAAAEGLDGLLTGEAQHHHAIEAAERGVTVFLGGHYATETWGVKELLSLLKDRFHIEGAFMDSPSGL